MRSLLLLVLLSTAPVLAQPESKPQLAQKYAQLPLSFEINRGQAPANIDFIAHGRGFTLGLDGGEALLSLQGQRSWLRLSVVGATRPSALPTELLPGHVNYFRGSEERQWLRDILTYGRVGYPRILPGVDLHFYGNQQKLEYDFVLSPGASPHELRMKVEGAQKLSLANDGSLIVHIGSRELKWHPPVSYQTINGSRRAVSSHYTIKGSNEFGFELGAYDRSKPLIIDPVLGYSTYLGGRGQDTVSDIALDNEGHAFVTGLAGSVSFPTTSGSYRPSSPTGYEGFVSKLSIDGSRLLYSTFLDSTDPQGIAVDGSGNAYIVGAVQAGRTIPTKNAYHSSPYGNLDAFLVKLNSSGSDIVYSTYFGGSQSDSARSVAVYNGTPYVYGWTTSGNLPLQSATQTQLQGSVDTFLTRFAADGQSLIFSTYLGGTDVENPADLAVDGNGNAYVTGQTNSLDFPTNNHIGAVDDLMAFVTKFSSSANIEYSTTINGTAGAEFNGFSPAGIAVDGSGNAYLTGNGGPGFTTTSGALNTASRCGANGCELRVVKLNSAGDALVYSAAFGGNTDEQANDIAIDSSGNAFVTGYTYSTNFPLMNPLQSQLNKGATGGCGSPESGFNSDCNDAFVTELNSSGSSLLFSTYFGGSLIDGGVALKWWNGRLFVTGNTQSQNFPVTANAFQKNWVGSTDPWVTRIDLSSSSGGGCTPQSDPGVKICSPTNGSIVPPGKVHIQAVTTSLAPVVGTKVYVDGQTKYSTSKASVDFYTTLTVKGQRRLTVKSWSSSGVIVSRTIYFTIQ